MSIQLFNNPNGVRGKAIVTIPIYQLYDLIRERLKYVEGHFDADALVQGICVMIEKNQGTYPNVPGLEES